MADNHNADCDDIIQWMDFAAGLPVCSQRTRLDFEISCIRNAITEIQVMGDNPKFMFSKRKQSSNLRKQILLLVYDAKKLLKEEFSYMQSEVHRMKGDISKFNAVVNLIVDGDIIQASGCPVSPSFAPEAARIRQWPWPLFLDKFLWNRKHNAYKLYGQYADLCITFEKYCVSFSTAQPEAHKSNNKIQTPVAPVRGTNPMEKRDHYRKSGDSAQPLVSSNISSHQVEKTVSQVDCSDVTGRSENISHYFHNSKLTDNIFEIRHESHNSLKLGASNMDKLIPVNRGFPSQWASIWSFYVYFLHVEQAIEQTGKLKRDDVHASSL